MNIFQLRIVIGAQRDNHTHIACVLQGDILGPASCTYQTGRTTPCLIVITDHELLRAAC